MDMQLERVTGRIQRLFTIPARQPDHRRLLILHCYEKYTRLGDISLDKRRLSWLMCVDFERLTRPTVHIYVVYAELQSTLSPSWIEQP